MVSQKLYHKLLNFQKGGRDDNLATRFCTEHTTIVAYQPTIRFVGSVINNGNVIMLVKVRIRKQASVLLKCGTF